MSDANQDPPKDLVKDDVAEQATNESSSVSTNETGSYSRADKKYQKREVNDEERAQANKRGQQNSWLRARKGDYVGNTAKRQRILERNPDSRILDETGNPVFAQEKRKPKRKVACLIGYCGTGYRGMQIQNNNEKTIEGDIFKAMVEAGAISKNNSNDLKKSDFMRAARTDKGVHAAGNAISLKMIIEDEDIVEKINSHLPDQIRFWGYSRVNNSFDCRKMCSSRVYEYLMPTYSFVPPKPSSSLGKLVTRDDLEDKEFWTEVYEEVAKQGVTEELMEEIEEFTKQGLQPSIQAQIAADNIKKALREKRNNFRISKGKLEQVQEALNLFKGHHNFHNFTLGKPFKDRSANRYMLDFKVSDPFLIEGMEWVSIKIHGQSFMLHQIRKMIGLTTLIIRTGAPISKITDAFNAQKINIPKAPALGLLLEKPVFDGYNDRLIDFGHEALSFTKYEKEMDAFKMKYIYDKIYEEEMRENVFYGFFGFIDSINRDVEDSNGGLSIANYLGSAKEEPAATESTEITKEETVVADPKEEENPVDGAEEKKD